MAYNETSFQPGQEKTPGSGRQKGTPNKARYIEPPVFNPHTALLNGALAECVQLLMPQVLKNLNALSLSTRPKDQAQFLSLITRLMPYVAQRGGTTTPLEPYEIDMLIPKPLCTEAGDQDAMDMLATKCQQIERYDYLSHHLQALSAMRDATADIIDLPLTRKECDR